MNHRGRQTGITALTPLFPLQDVPDGCCGLEPLLHVQVGGRLVEHVNVRLKGTLSNVRVQYQAHGFAMQRSGTAFKRSGTVSSVRIQYQAYGFGMQRSGRVSSVRVQYQSSVRLQCQAFAYGLAESFFRVSKLTFCTATTPMAKRCNSPPDSTSTSRSRTWFRSICHMMEFIRGKKRKKTKKY